MQVTNTGTREGQEAVQLFSSDLIATQVSPDVRRLRRFDKIALRPSKTKIVTFVLPLRELAYAGPTGTPVLEPGDFDLRIADLVQRITLR